MPCRGDLTPIDGGEGVQLVLEINGGLAARLGIAPGAELRHPAIGACRRRLALRGLGCGTSLTGSRVDPEAKGSAHATVPDHRLRRPGGL